jgi:hypothetical protein
MAQMLRNKADEPAACTSCPGKGSRACDTCPVRYQWALGKMQPGQSVPTGYIQASGVSFGNYTLTTTGIQGVYTCSPVCSMIIPAYPECYWPAPARDNRPLLDLLGNAGLI